MKEEEARMELYWEAVFKLRQYIEEGHASTEEVLEELEEDLPEREEPK